MDSKTMHEVKITAAAAIAGWIEDFNQSIAAGDADAVAALFHDDCYWRDLLLYQPDFRTIEGPAAVATGLVRDGRTHGISSFAIDDRLSSPRCLVRIGRDVIEAFVVCTSAGGTGRGVLRLTPDATGARDFKAWGLMTSLQEVAGHPEAAGDRRPLRARDDGSDENWADLRDRQTRHDAEAPEVLVIGAGHSGLMMAARLKAMGVRTLIVERLPRVGDVWRNRYHTLQLHNEIGSIPFPYVSYPETWPTFLPKDMYAMWLEWYAQAMELTIWTQSDFVGANYDNAARCWVATVSRNGETVTLRPRHVVLATGGVSGRKHSPVLPGIEAFAGQVVHSTDFRSSKTGYRDRKAIVVGASTSGHDVALELVQCGCDVTMIQRGAINVVSSDMANRMYSVYSEGRSLDEIDLLSISWDYGNTITQYRNFAKEAKKVDSDLVSRLARVGFRTDDGYLEGGYFANYNEKGGGYYIDVGASEYVCNGAIKVVQQADVDRFVRDGLLMADGGVREADIVVMATGYLNQEADIRQYFGDDVARKVGKIWGWDEGGELRRAWRPTGQPGLWLQMGSISQSRVYSRLTALQIVMDLKSR